MVVPFHASAASTVTGSVDRHALYGSVTHSQTSAQASTSITGTAASYVRAEVTFVYGYGGSTKSSNASNDGISVTGVTAICSPSGYPVGISSTGKHYLEYAGYTWRPVNTYYYYDYS